MSVITFSRHFQTNHPRKGDPTFFVEKIWKGLWDLSSQNGKCAYLGEYQQKHDNFFGIDQVINVHQFEPKWHTIRAGKRFKPGDFFDPRIWSGRPYKSAQIQIAPAIEVKKTWDFEVDEMGVVSIGGFYYFPEEPLDQMYDYVELAKNDGLSAEDFYNWIIQPCFKNHKKFEGQIICWNENIEYV